MSALDTTDKALLDSLLTETRETCAANPIDALTVRAWFLRWLYDRAHAIHLPKVGGTIVMLRAINYLPAADVQPFDVLMVRTDVLLGLIDGP